jgi:hypothetical protein
MLPTSVQWWALKRRKHRFILKAPILYEKSDGLFTFSKVGSVNFIVPMIFSKFSPLILSFDKFFDTKSVNFIVAINFSTLSRLILS